MSEVEKFSKFLKWWNDSMEPKPTPEESSIVKESLTAQSKTPRMAGTAEDFEQRLAKEAKTPRTYAVAFHARPTYGPAEGAEVCVPVNAMAEIETELAEAIRERDKWKQKFTLSEYARQKMEGDQE